jgi:preprotein translocase subunit SecE
MDKRNIFARFGARIVRWFRETRSELKKVVWPTRKQLINNTGIVIVAVIIVGAAMSVMDMGFQQLIHRLPYILMGRV